MLFNQHKNILSKKSFALFLMFCGAPQTSQAFEPVTTAALILAGWSSVKGYKYYKQKRTNSAFIQAVKASKRRETRNCLKNGADVNQVVEGQAAIHIACENGEYSIVKMLIDFGADLNLTDKQGRSPLIIALCGESYQNLSVLLNSDLIESHKKGSLLFPNCDRSLYQPIIDLLMEHTLQWDIEDNLGGTALAYAVLLQDVQMVRALLQAGARCDARDDKDLKVFDRAVLAQADEIQKELEKYNAPAGPRLFSLLMQAGRADEAMQYIDAIEVNNKEHNNLHWAVFQGHQNLVDLLLKRNASVDLVGLLDCTPIYHAVGIHKLTDVIICFSNVIIFQNKFYRGKHWKNYVGIWWKMSLNELSKSSSYINLICFDPQDEENYLAITQKLLNQGINLNTRLTFLGITPLHVAAAVGSRKMVNLLLQHGSDSKIRDKQLKKTAYDFAKLFGHKDVMQLLENA